MLDGISPNHRIFGSRFDQTRTSVARTAQAAEDARERMETYVASFPLKMVNRLKVRPKVSVDSLCVEPSAKIFRGRRFDTISTFGVPTFFPPKIPAKLFLY